MKFPEYIDKYHPIDRQIEESKTNPIKRVMERDDLPYDDIKMVDGVHQKIVYVSDDTYVTVLDLLSYDKSDVDKMDDEDFKKAYNAYIDNVDILPMDLDSLIAASKDYAEKSERKSSLLRTLKES